MWLVVSGTKEPESGGGGMEGEWRGRERSLVEGGLDWSWRLQHTTWFDCVEGLDVESHLQ